MKTVAIANLKGGVAKTTITHNLAGVLSEQGKRVLLVDMDYQSNLTALFEGDEARFENSNIARVLFDHLPLSDAIKGTNLKGVAILAADIDLALLDSRFANDPDAQYLLAELLDGQKKNFDHVLIDCPPNLLLGTRMALVAAYGYLVPVAADRFSLRAAVHVGDVVASIRKRANPKLELLGILLSRITARRKVTEDYIELFTKQFGNRLLKTQIKETIKFQEAATAGEPITTYLPTSEAADMFRTLAQEIHL
jgi:chromosome partitioning protein